MDMIEQAFSSAIFHADRDASLADCITPADVVAGAIIGLWTSGLPREALVDKDTTPDDKPRPLGGNVVAFRR